MIDLELNNYYIDLLKKIIKNLDLILIQIDNDGIYIINNINNFSNFIIFIKKELFSTFKFKSDVNNYLIEDINILKKLNYKNILKLNYFETINFNKIKFEKKGEIKFKDICNKFKFLENKKLDLTYNKNFDYIFCKGNINNLSIFVNIII